MAGVCRGARARRAGATDPPPNRSAAQLLQVLSLRALLVQKYKYARVGQAQLIRRLIAAQLNFSRYPVYKCVTGTKVKILTPEERLQQATLSSAVAVFVLLY